MKESFQALGTTWWIEIFDDLSQNDFSLIVDDCHSFCSDYENKYSRFKPDSEITTLNTKKELGNPSAEMIDLLSIGKKLYLETNTKFNILTGHQQEASGYDQNYSFKPTNPEATEAGNPITDLVVSEESIKLLHGKIDLGGFGKGYLVDRLANYLTEKYSLKYFLINGGGDMYATTLPDEEAVEIYLEHPINHQPIYKTTLKNQGFAASSPFRRQWTYEGKNYHHLLNSPAEIIESSFIKADSTTYADVVATSILLTKPADLHEIIDAHQVGFAIFDTVTKQLKFNKLFK